MNNPNPRNEVEETSARRDHSIKEDNSSKEALVLDTLAADNVEEVENKKEYIPPKSKKNLSPSVRKIVEEENIDITNVAGSGPKGNIVKADVLKLMGNIPGPSKRAKSRV